MGVLSLHGGSECEGEGVAIFCEFFEGGSAWGREIEESSGFVESFSCGVIECLSEDGVVARFFDEGE